MLRCRSTRAPQAGVSKKKMKNLIVTVALVLLFATTTFAEEKHNYKPDSGYVPNADTAIKIAIAVWEPIYGKKHIEGQSPYRSELINGVWHVKGSLEVLKEGRDKHGNKIATITAGGVAEAEISKTTGEILRISHGE